MKFFILIFLFGLSITKANGKGSDGQENLLGTGQTDNLLDKGSTKLLGKGQVKKNNQGMRKTGTSKIKKSGSSQAKNSKNQNNFNKYFGKKSSESEANTKEESGSAGGGVSYTNDDTSTGGFTTFLRSVTRQRQSREEWIGALKMYISGVNARIAERGKIKAHLNNQITQLMFSGFVSYVPPPTDGTEANKRYQKLFKTMKSELDEIHYYKRMQNKRVSINSCTEEKEDFFRSVAAGGGADMVGTIGGAVTGGISAGEGFLEMNTTCKGKEVVPTGGATEGKGVSCDAEAKERRGIANELRDIKVPEAKSLRDTACNIKPLDPTCISLTADHTNTLTAATSAEQAASAKEALCKRCWLSYAKILGGVLSIGGALMGLMKQDQADLEDLGAGEGALGDELGNLDKLNEAESRNFNKGDIQVPQPDFDGLAFTPETAATLQALATNFGVSPKDLANAVKDKNKQELANLGSDKGFSNYLDAKSGNKGTSKALQGVVNSVGGGSKMAGISNMINNHSAFSAKEKASLKNDEAALKAFAAKYKYGASGGGGGAGGDDGYGLADDFGMGGKKKGIKLDDAIDMSNFKTGKKQAGDEENSRAPASNEDESVLNDNQSLFARINNRLIILIGAQ